MKWLLPILCFLAAACFFVAALIQRAGVLYITIGLMMLAVLVRAIHRVELGGTFKLAAPDKGD